MRSGINKCDEQLCPRQIPGEHEPILLHPKKGNSIHSHVMFEWRTLYNTEILGIKNVYHTFAALLSITILGFFTVSMKDCVIFHSALMVIQPKLQNT